jgi:hypothetical protein
MSMPPLNDLIQIVQRIGYCDVGSGHEALDAALLNGLVAPLTPSLVSSKPTGRPSWVRNPRDEAAEAR